MHPRSLKKPFPSSINNMIFLQGMQNTCWWLKAKQAICDHSQLIHSICKSVLEFIKQGIHVFCFRCSFLKPVLEYRVLSLVTLQERHLPVRAGLKGTMKAVRKLEHVSYDRQQAEGDGWGCSAWKGEDSWKNLLQPFSS